MPVACSTSALTGADGSLYYTPAATKWCLLDFTDFPAGTDITVPAKHDFRVGDPILFTQENGGQIDSAFTTASADLRFFVVATTDTTISVSATKGGTPVTSGGAGGTAGEDTPGGHIRIEYDPYGAVCQIQSWDLEISRESLDVTTLPCGVGAGSATAGKYAAFRKTQPGFASGTGNITVIFTDNDDALGQRMLDNVLLSSQEGARVRLFVNTVAGTSDVDLTNSMYIEADISLESMSLSVNPDDPITAEIGYSVSNVAHLFKTAVA